MHCPLVLLSTEALVIGKFLNVKRLPEVVALHYDPRDVFLLFMG